MVSVTAEVDGDDGHEVTFDLCGVQAKAVVRRGQAKADLAIANPADLGSEQMLDAYHRKRHFDVQARVTGIDALRRFATYMVRDPPPSPAEGAATSSGEIA